MRIKMIDQHLHGMCHHCIWDGHSQEIELESMYEYVYNLVHNNKSGRKLLAGIIG